MQSDAYFWPECTNFHKVRESSLAFERSLMLFFCIHEPKFGNDDGKSENVHKKCASCKVCS